MASKISTIAVPVSPGTENKTRKHNKLMVINTASTALHEQI